MSKSLPQPRLEPCAKTLANPDLRAIPQYGYVVPVGVLAQFLDESMFTIADRSALGQRGCPLARGLVLNELLTCVRAYRTC